MENNISYRSFNIISTERDSESSFLNFSQHWKDIIDNKIKDKIQPSLSDITDTHTMYINGTYKPYIQTCCTYFKTSPQTALNFGKTSKFHIKRNGVFISDMVLHIKLSNMSVISPEDKIRYVSFLGHKLIKNVKFYKNNKLLDQYGTEEYNAHYQFKVLPNKKKAWLKNIGQEIPEMGCIMSDLDNCDIQEYKMFCSGNQTLKSNHESVDLFIPLIFWFNDIKHALPMFPYNSSCFIEVELSPLDDIVSFLNKSNSEYNKPTIEVGNLYVNNITIPTEITKLLKNQISIVRTHYKQTIELDKPHQEIEINQKRLENLYVSFTPNDNSTNSQMWHKNLVLKSNKIKVPVIKDDQISIGHMTYYSNKPTIDNITLKCGDLDIYNSFHENFFNSYTPYIFGDSVNTPDDGWYMINSNIKPNQHQPSGIFPVNKNHPLKLSYISSFIDDNNKTTMNILGDIINVYKYDQATLNFS